jgi:long-chain fatty acid transport protein
MYRLSSPTVRSLSLATVLAALAGSPALAEGFRIQEYSVRDMGLANSGNAALAADASTVFANPAGLPRLDGPQLNVGVHGILGRGAFSNDGSTDATGAPLAGGDGGDLFANAAIPNAYYARPIGDGRAWFGIGLTSPFGLSTDYDSGWVGRYQTLESDLTAIDINPALGITVNDWLSLGVGVSAQYASVRLTNAIDFGSVCLARIEPAAPGSCTALGALPQQADGFVKLDGSDWTLGYNLGALFTLTDATRIGLAYRSAIDHEIDGDAQFAVPASLSGLLAPAFTDTTATAPLNLPARLSLSFHHQATERLALTGDVSWSQWERFDGIAVDFDNPAQPDQTETLNYDNTMRYAAGAEYALDAAWTVRGGVAIEQTPTDPDFRSPRVPDEDRTTVALGASWTPRDALTVDAGYQHIFFKDAAIDQTGTGGDTLVGAYGDNAADLVSLGLTWRF